MAFEGNRKYSTSLEGLFQGNMEDIRLVNCALLGHSQRDLFIKGKEYKVDVARFAEKAGLSLPKAYRKALELANKLLTTVVTIDRGKGVLEHTHLVHSVIEDAETKGLAVRWHEEAIPYLSGTMAPGKFITYNTAMDTTKSSARFRLYTLLSRHIYKVHAGDSFRLSVEELKEEIELPEGKYKVYSDLYKRIIRPALDDIMEHTGVSLVAKGVTLGRKTHWVEFSSGRLIDL